MFKRIMGLTNIRDMIRSNIESEILFPLEIGDKSVVVDYIMEYPESKMINIEHSDGTVGNVTSNINKDNDDLIIINPKIESKHDKHNTSNSNKKHEDIIVLDVL